MIQRRGSAKKKHEARAMWLSARLHLHEGVPGIHQDVTEDGRVKLDALHHEMSAAGLFGAITPQAQRETIRRLVSELRGHRIEVEW